MIPFTIQLKRQIDNPVGGMEAGIDDGAKQVGVTIVNPVTKEIIFKGVLRLRLDVSKKLTQRATYRKARRGRKLRYRQASFLNRKQVTPLPSVRQRKDSIIRWVKDICKIVKIDKVTVEEGQFDVSSMAAGRQMLGKEFQQSQYEGENLRQKVLWRDGYKCVYCGSTERLTQDHILPKSRCGTDTLKNLVCACYACNQAKKDLTPQEWKGLDIKPKQFQYPAWLMIGKKYLRQQLEWLGLQPYRVVGWQTSYWRKRLNLDKNHENDAVAMVCRNRFSPIDKTGKTYLILPRRRKVWINNPTKISTEKQGFKHFDIVKAIRKNNVVVGSIRALKQRAITLRTIFDDNYAVSYSKTELLWRFNGVLYI